MNVGENPKIWWELSLPLSVFLTASIFSYWKIADQSLSKSSFFLILGDFLEFCIIGTRAVSWACEKINMAPTRNQIAMEDAFKALMEEHKIWMQGQIVLQNQRLLEQQTQISSHQQQMAEQQ